MLKYLHIFSLLCANINCVFVHIVKITVFHTKNKGKIWKFVVCFVNLQARNPMIDCNLWKHPLLHFENGDLHLLSITTKKKLQLITNMVILMYS